MNALVLWGAGGHGRVVLDVAAATGRFSEIVFVDEDVARAGRMFCGRPVFSSLEQLSQAGYSHAPMVVAIGANTTRARCAAIARSFGWRLATLAHPSAIVSTAARLGEGTVVMPRAVVNAGAAVGENCIINTGAIVEHDCRVGDHAHLSPGVILGGAVRIAPLVHMGLGAIALPGSVIETRAVVGAGAVVLRNVSPGETVIGIPARRAVERAA